MGILYDLAGTLGLPLYKRQPKKQSSVSAEQVKRNINYSRYASKSFEERGGLDRNRFVGGKLQKAGSKEYSAGRKAGLTDDGRKAMVSAKRPTI